MSVSMLLTVQQVILYHTWHMPGLVPNTASVMYVVWYEVRYQDGCICSTVAYRMLPAFWCFIPDGKKWVSPWVGASTKKASDSLAYIMHGNIMRRSWCKSSSEGSRLPPSGAGGIPQILHVAATAEAKSFLQHHFFNCYCRCGIQYLLEAAMSRPVPLGR